MRKSFKRNLLLLSSLFVLSSSMPVVQVNAIFKDNDVSEIIKQREKDFKELEEVELFTGLWIGGVDVPVGRYVITGSGMGNFFIDSDNGDYVNEILVDTADEWGVTSITVDIKENDQIDISGINTVWFTPYETELRSELGSGVWIVGVDIEPGNYIATTENGSGNFFVDGGSRYVNEILDSSGEWGVEKIALTLEEGQEITISGLESVQFTER